jgi:hypothetical protein
MQWDSDFPSLKYSIHWGYRQNLLSKGDSLCWSRRLGSFSSFSFSVSSLTDWEKLVGNVNLQDWSGFCVFWGLTRFWGALGKADAGNESVSE